jgi:uncharacterized surface protein with fasciclin (FAS1) repeats
MNRQILAFIWVLIMVLSACRKQALDEFYGPPADLSAPIYQQLEAKGNFKSFLACIDKAGYKSILRGAGYWTIFAPHDSAFQAYFRDKGISGVEQLDSAACSKLVTYALTYNAFKRERLDDYQSNVGWVPNIAFRRRTAQYLGVYDGTNTSGAPIKVINSNRNNNGTTFYVDADYNNKYITYFENNFMTGRGLSAFDYNYFFPNSTYTGFNVMGAKVVESDLVAENGVVHIIDRVIEALPGLDEYLASQPQYSEFKKMMDRFLVQYVLNASVTANYRAVTGRSDQVFTKVFSNSIAFSPNNENFLKLQDNDGQQNCYTMFVPNNTAFNAYVQSVLLENYPSIDALPINVVNDFINAHMWQTAVWPSKFSTTFNFLGEEARFNPVTDIDEKRILSNGFFYGTKKVQQANVFSSVYGVPYLDPNYSMMTSLLNQELKIPLSNLNQKYTLFLISNSALNAAGYFFDPTVDINPNFQWRYIPPGGGPVLTGSSALIRLTRLLHLHVAPEVDVTSLSGSGMVRTYGGEYIRFNNQSVAAAGNIDSNRVALSTRTRTTANGTVHYLNRILEFTALTIGRHIEILGTPTTSEFNFFWQYLRNSSIFTPGVGDIAGLVAGTSYTVFIPNNNAIRAAVNAGLLPGTGTAPNRVPLFNPTLPADRERVVRFINYHILDKKTLATDGRDSGPAATLFRNQAGDQLTLFINNGVPGSMNITDARNRNASLVVPSSNFLSNRCVIHLLNNYLEYVD